jgi:TusA-related sulfurtransferase
MRGNPRASAFDIVADDPAAAKDVPAFAEENGLRIEARGALAWRLTRPPRTPPGDQ